MTETMAKSPGILTLVKWLNTNQGFVMSVLTLVYVAATLVIVRYTRKSIQELQKTREEESRPYIFAYLHRDPRDASFHFRVQNYGKTGGRIESIDVTPELAFPDAAKPGEFLNDVVLAPNQMLHFILFEHHKETSNKRYNVAIKYVPTSNDRRVYEEAYSLITQYSAQMAHINWRTSNLSQEENALKNIADCLDSIRNRL